MQFASWLRPSTELKPFGPRSPTAHLELVVMSRAEAESSGCLQRLLFSLCILSRGSQVVLQTLRLVRNALRTTLVLSVLSMGSMVPKSSNLLAGNVIRIFRCSIDTTDSQTPGSHARLPCTYDYPCTHCVRRKVACSWPTVESNRIPHFLGPMRLSYGAVGSARLDAKYEKAGRNVRMEWQGAVEQREGESEI